MSNFGIRKLIVFSLEQSSFESKRLRKKTSKASQTIMAKLGCWLLHMISKIPRYAVIRCSLDRSFN